MPLHMICKSGSHKGLTITLDIILVLLGSIVLWRSASYIYYIYSTDAPFPLHPLQPNIALSLPSVQWNQALHHVVLFVQTTCGACNQNAPFYRDLSNYVHRVTSYSFIVLAVESEPVVKAWLSNHNIQPDRIVRISSPVQYGFLVSPTLLMVDNRGIVSDTILYRMNSEDQKHFMARLVMPNRLRPINNAQYPNIVTIEDYQILSRQSNIALLDIQNRSSYARSHMPNSKNIPADELIARAPAEISQLGPVILDCRAVDRGECQMLGLQLIQQGYARLFLVIK